MATLRLTRAEYRERFGKLPPAHPKPKPAVKQAKAASTTVKPRSAIKRTKLWRSEWDFQAAVIAECDRRGGLYSLVSAIPNGQYRKGNRLESGTRPGLPDIFLPVPRAGHGACFIELKVGKNTCREKQTEMHARLRAAGNYVAVVWDSVDEVMCHFEMYLAGRV